VGTGAVGRSDQGISVSLSADGNTAIVGGVSDNSFAGAAWVFTRSGGVWTQQGDKLVGTGAAVNADQGNSVALSADGNTAIVGGPVDRSAWVFTRSGGVWTQQGNKLVGTGEVGVAEQGFSVALSADGNTAVVGGQNDNGGLGAVWVYTRSGGVWTQQGSKLVGTGAVGSARQGNSVALSADGNTAIVGGPGDNPDSNGDGAGATWVFNRNGGVWTQQGSKLVGTGAVGHGAGQGTSVAVSGDGNTVIVGGPYDNSDIGAAWVFVQPTTAPFSAFSAKLNIYFTRKVCQTRSPARFVISSFRPLPKLATAVRRVWMASPAAEAQRRGQADTREDVDRGGGRRAEGVRAKRVACSPGLKPPLRPNPGRGGARPGAGRPKGVPNKITSTFRDFVIQAVAEAKTTKSCNNLGFARGSFSGVLSAQSAGVFSGTIVVFSFSIITCAPTNTNRVPCDRRSDG
jgi:hypothetical protein